MRRIFALVAAVCLILAPGFMSAAEKPDLNLHVRINYVISSIGLPPESGDVYYMSIKDGRMKTFLPFIGTSDSAGYGSAYNPSIDVDSEIEDCTEKVNKKRKETEYRFTCTDSNNLKWKVTLTVYDGETVTALFFNSSRSPMTYRGYVAAPEEGE